MNLIALETGAELAVASTGVAYSQSFLTPNFSSAALEYQFTSDGTVDVKVEIESGEDAPATEGSADTDGYGVGNQISSSIADENVHWSAPSPTVSKRLRLKLTGQGSNDASTKLTKLKLHYVSA
jgi:hypothetical protein